MCLLQELMIQQLMDPTNDSSEEINFRRVKMVNRERKNAQSYRKKGISIHLHTPVKHFKYKVLINFLCYQFRITSFE